MFPPSPVPSRAAAFAPRTSADEDTASPTQADVVIVGGGLCGSVLALMLASLRRADGQALRIALLEADDASTAAPTTFDRRAIALNAGSVALLQRYALWPLFAPRACPIETIHISQVGQWGQTQLVAAEQNLPAFGYVVELAAVGERLRQALAACPHIMPLAPARVTNLSMTTGGLMAQLAQGGAVQGALLVSSDGPASVAARHWQLGAQCYDPAQQALIATVRCQSGLNGRAFERFTRAGPLALLPLDAQHASLVWCMAPAQASQLLAASDSEFLAALQAAFGWRAGKFIAISGRASYPLKTQVHEYPVAPRTVLVGNAAHSLHPVAGQGFNLGLRDIAELTACLAPVVGQGGDVGAADVLATYWQRRQADQRGITQLTNASVSLFVQDSVPLAWARSAGLAAVGGSAWLAAALVAPLAFGMGPRH
ncbi:MAG: 2-octaprenyl-6-methoxyphenyl hydroxylase [Aeromonas sp.]